MFKPISITLILWFIGTALFYNLRFVAGGQLVVGSTACLIFGYMLYIAVEILTRWEKGQRWGTLIDVVWLGWLGWMWYKLMHHVNQAWTTGIPLYLPDEKIESIFGIDGYLGLAIVMPMYILLVIILVCILLPLLDIFSYRRKYDDNDYYCGKILLTLLKGNKV